jgi:hypothetical protein
MMQAAADRGECFHCGSAGKLVNDVCEKCGWNAPPSDLSELDKAQNAIDDQAARFSG